TYLQVFLDKAFRLATDKDKVKPGFTNELLEQVGDVSDLLGNFLEEQISALDDPETGLTILKSFVSIKGTKRQISEEEIIEFSQTLGNPVELDELKDLIQKFINLRILRDKDESGRYELRHDSLATKIYEKITLVEKEILEVRQFIDNAYSQYEKRKIYLTAKDLKYIAPYEDKLFINKETERFIKDSKSVLQKAKKKIKRIAIAGFFAILLISTGTIFRTFQLPLSAFIIYAGSILYIAWFLPLFSFYVFKTKENRTINLLFLMFTVIFLGTIYLYNTSVKRVLFKPVIITEQKLQNTIDNLGLKNVGLYNDINKLAEENPGTTGNYKSQAIQVNERTTELFNYIQDIKIEIVSITEGIEEDNLEENGINIESLRRIDENNIPAEILIGVDDNGKAFDLKAVIIDYKQFLSGIVEENPMIKESLERTLNTDDPIGSDKNVGWERYNFEGLSLGFVITTLSKIQSEIKYAEMEVLSYLFEQMDNAIKEVVRRIPIVVVSSLKMNVFYIGVDNPVNIAVPGVDQDNITVSSSNGTITREQGYFNVRPTVLQDCNITVVAEIDNIHRAFPPIRFRVKNIPDPVATVGGINGGMIKKEDLLNAKGIKAAISSDFDFDIQFEVTGFQVGMSDRGFFVIAQASNSLFTEDQKKLIMRVKRNDRIMITNIQAVGPTGKTRDLNGIILQIIE
ncbi:MAG: hypothetical protein KAT38_13295, partial [Bacteroidales bacterium]|nr:hypothetical protein [Bacteroidales bacterium]